MSEEELQELQEELAAARSELERLQVTAADREARAAHVETELSALQHELAGAREQAQSREEELRAQNEALSTQAHGTAQRYRELILLQSPELPEELVTGESVAEIDAALEAARETVSKVRGHLESQAQATRVPVGAPVRSGPDVSGMNAEEKIREGLRQKNG
jgi:predicted  nucleic acid-binding Zn-ribbon protein